MSATPYVAAEAADGARVAFTFGADIDTVNHRIVLDRLEQGNTIDYTVTSTRGITFTAAPVADALVWLFNGVAGVTQATSLPSWATVATVINDAAWELGLIKADITDPFASTDANILLLIRLLKSGGREMAKYRDWQHLQKEFTFETETGTDAYPLPSDFRKMVPDTTWDRTSQFQGSLVTGKGWQMLKASSVATPVGIMYRIWLGQIFIRDPADAQTIAFEYQSSSWIKPSGQTYPTSDAPAAFDDTVCFDSRLAVARLKRDFRRNKKQDSQAEEDDYRVALSDAENEDATAETIYLGGAKRLVRKIDRWNLPDTIT